MSAPSQRADTPTVLGLVALERDRQRRHVVDQLAAGHWVDVADPSTSDAKRCQVITEEYLEYVRALNDGEPAGRVVEELVQIAALTVAAVEGILAREARRYTVPLPRLPEWESVPAAHAAMEVATQNGKVPAPAPGPTPSERRASAPSLDPTIARRDGSPMTADEHAACLEAVRSRGIRTAAALCATSAAAIRAWLDGHPDENPLLRSEPTRTRRRVNHGESAAERPARSDRPSAGPDDDWVAEASRRIPTPPQPPDPNTVPCPDCGAVLPVSIPDGVSEGAKALIRHQAVSHHRHEKGALACPGKQRP